MFTAVRVEAELEREEAKIVPEEQDSDNGNNHYIQNHDDKSGASPNNYDGGIYDGGKDDEKLQQDSGHDHMDKV